MKKNLFFFLFSFSFLVSFNNANAQITVTPAANGTCLNVSPGAYTTLGAITIAEGARTDWSNSQANVTIILTAPANFQFDITAVLSTAGSTTTDVTIVSAVMTNNTTITITISTDGGANNPADVIILNGVKVRSTLAGATGQIRRTGGTAVGAGYANNDGKNHGTLITTGATFTTTAAGNWSAGGTWVGGVAPSASCHNVVIAHAVTADVTSSVNNLTINTGGNLTSTNAITVAGTFAINGTGIYTHNNTTAASTSIFNGTEAFASTCSIIVNNWSSSAVPFPTGVNGNFGNVTLNWNSAWEQNGLFSTNSVQGNFTISNGSVNLDGVGVSTSLTIGGNFLMSSPAGTHSLYSAASVPAAFTLNIGGTMTVNSTNNWYMFVGTGTNGQSCNITINSGAWVLGGDFFVATGCLDLMCTQFVTFDVVANVNGSITFNGPTTGQNFDIVYRSRGDCDIDMNVTGDIIVTSAPGWFHFDDRTDCTGDLTIDCVNLTINAGADNSFAKTNAPVTISCTGNFTHAGATTVTNFLDRSVGGGSAVTFSAVNTTMSAGTFIGNDTGDGNFNYTNTGNFNMTGGTFTGINSGDGVLTFNVSGNSNMSVGTFEGINTGNGNATFNILGNSIMSSGIYYGIEDGTGNLTYNVTGSLSESGGNMRGIQSLATFDAGIIAFNLGSVNFTGGSFLGQYACHTDGLTHTFSVLNNMNITYGATTDLFALNRLATLGGTNNTALLTFTVGGHLTISGVNGQFNSNNGSGVETTTIVGNVSISNGDNSFNVVQNSGLTTGHNATHTINGSLTVSGGITNLSSMSGILNCTVTGAVLISSGTLIAKGDIGVGTVNFNSTYTQTGGIYYLHHHPATATSNVCTTNIQGDFSQTGGVLNFDNIITGTAINVINFYGSSFVFGGTGKINRNAAPGTAVTNTNANFGEFYFARTGTTTYNNSAAPAATHFIQGVKQFVNSVTTVDASAATTNPFLVSSNSVQNNIAGTNAKWALNVNGILNMGVGKISSFPAITAYYSGIRVNAAARLRTSNTAGFFDGTTNACLQPQVFSGNTSYRMDFNLDATSIVEYYASANQTVTGKFPNVTAGTLDDVALATAAQYHYGYLDINNQGTLGTNFAFPAVPGSGTGNVFVRTSLLLTRGELNLAGSGTGQTITMENGTTGGITRDGATTNGYIKSEEANGGQNRAKVMWNMGANTGAHIYPFGYTTGASNYVPFTFDKTTAGAADITVSTRATAANDNLPWALVSSVAQVTIMPSPAGGYTNACVPSVIDRWWDITAAGTVTANLTFTYRGAENTTTLSPTGNFGAQHWNGGGWDLPVGSAVGVTTGTGSVTASGRSTFSPWVLSSLVAPLPIELINFESVCYEDEAIVYWSTATEENNEYFTLEKSLDGVNYSTLEKIKSKSPNGNSQSVLNYEYLDKNANGNTYYRLSQTDNNSKTTFLKVISMSGCNDKQSNIDAFAYDKMISIVSNDKQTKEYSVKVLNTLGQTILEKNINISNGHSELKLDCNFLSNGVYYINIIDENETIMVKKIILSN